MKKCHAVWIRLACNLLVGIDRDLELSGHILMSEEASSNLPLAVLGDRALSCGLSAYGIQGYLELEEYTYLRINQLLLWHKHCSLYCVHGT